MIHTTIDPQQPKGWLFGPWNSAIPIAVGYANEGIAERHYHTQIYEVYLVARGSCTMQIDDQTLTLTAGDVVAVELNEVHTFLASSPDYLHFVLHSPVVPGDKVVVAAE
jgi:quercetin dioxygenase-like cupin family protein